MVLSVTCCTLVISAASMYFCFSIGFCIDVGSNYLCEFCLKDTVSIFMMVQHLFI